MMKIQAILFALLATSAMAETITCDFPDTTVSFSVDPAIHDITVVDPNTPPMSIEVTFDGETVPAMPIVAGDLRGFTAVAGDPVGIIMVKMSADRTAKLRSGPEEWVAGTCQVTQ